MTKTDSWTWKRVRALAALVALTTALPLAAAPRAASMRTARAGHAATLLPNGTLLLTGGENRGGAVGVSDVLDLASAEIAAGPALLTPRVEHTATLLPDGRVLVAGGRLNGIHLDSTELLDHGAFVPGPRLAAPRTGHTATLLGDGRVLIAGGDSEGTLEIFDPAGDRVLAAGRMSVARTGHSAFLLADGRVLLAGGQAGDAKALSSAELFDPKSGASSALSMLAARVHPILRQLPDGKVQVMGGDDEITMEMFNVAESRFTARAHLLLGSSNVSTILASPARGVLFGAAKTGAVKATGAVGALLNRSGHTLTEATAYNEAIVAGGVSRGAMMGASLSTGGATTLAGVTTLDACAASVTTDKTDYMPGETVTITGTGFQGGETVNLVLTVDPLTHADVTWSVTADVDGNFVDSSYVVQQSDLGVTFLLTATGAASGCAAQTTFTDSVTSVTITSPTSGSPVTVSALPGTVNVSFSYVTSGTGATTADIDILPGPVASLSGQTITAGSGSTTIPIAIPIGTASGSYNLKVTVHNSTGTAANNKNDSQNGAIIVSACTPVISLSGANPLNVECSNTFSDPGATATCGATVTSSGSVDTSTPGDYTITYSATGATSVTRTVHVQDTTKPVITLTGSTPVTIECHTSYLDAGATASDTCAGNLTGSIVASGTVDVNTVGSYTIHYNVSDPAGNGATEVTRTVNVVDTTKPVITLTGSASVTVECHTPYADAGATASDTCAGDLTGSISVTGNVDANTVGTYTLHYNVSDPAGNGATEVTRTVNVVDTTKPVITLNGSAAVTVECHTSYSDAGATANDSCAGSVPVTPSGTVNVNIPGSYTITYTATDPSGNTQTATRTVNVADTTAPALSCPAAATALAGAGCQAAVPDMNVMASDSCAGAILTTQSPAPGTLVGIGSTTVTLTATDPSGNTATCQTTFSVTNDAPVITSVTGPASPLAIGTPASITANFTDTAVQGHTCTFSWDDGGPNTSVTAGATSCTATHTYAAAGVYGVTVTVADDCSASDTDVFQYVVVYDPNAGFVTGGGFINSPAGAYLADTSLSGKATFGFVSKYQKGAKVPTGQTEFQFQVAGFNFHSTVYEWLVVSGAKAQYKGSGTVNNGGDYGFLLTATDGQITGGGGVDKFRIKIWDNNAGGAVVYDNVYGASDDIDSANPQAIAGGSIVIHSK